MDELGKNQKGIIKSDLNITKWKEELISDCDRDFLLTGIAEGFYITNVEKEVTSVRTDNYQSAIEHRKAVEKQINIELEEGRYVIVDTPPTIISALGAIPKDDGSVRLIHDASKPDGRGLNDYAVPDYNVRYQTVRDACELLSKGGFMAKIDLKSAYRSVPLHPSQYKYTGLQWTFIGETEPTFMIDTRLPFGARLSPSHFHRLTQSVKRMLQKRGINTVVYLDDFFITAPSFDQCQEHLTTTIQLLRSLGWAIAWPKVVGPSQIITFLGIEMDSIAMQIRLPMDKVNNYLELLRVFLGRSRASQRQLQQLAGKLSYASHVVKGGSIYLQRVLDLLRSVRRPQHKIRLGDEFKKDIHWWLTLLKISNSTPIQQRDKPIVEIVTDASQSGAGMISRTDWAYVDWKNDLPHMQSKHINVKETIAIIAAAYRWAPTWTNKHVIVYTDNMTARAAINKGRCTDKETMQHIRNLFWLSHFLNFSIHCVHIKGTDNVQADSVSRLRQKGHVLYWLSKLANGQCYDGHDVCMWFLGHMSVTTCAILFSQLQRSIPRLRLY